jgi:uncharacterized protein (TIGR02231 family)
MSPHSRLLDAEVPVVEVTLLEDRALVVRQGLVAVPAGRSRLRIGGVAPVLVDKTLAASLTSTTAPTAPTAPTATIAQVRSVEVTRRRVVTDRDRPAALAELRDRRRTREAELAALDRDRTRIRAEQASLARLAELSVAEINEDVSWANADRSRWTAQLDQLDAAQRQLAHVATRLAHEHAELTRTLADLGVAEAALSSANSEVRAELELELDNPGEAETLELRVDYLVPGALWRPWHSARLIEPGPGDPGSEAGARLVFTCAAAVWQNTGEDWREVDLIFSTERPSLGVAPPTLVSDTLTMRKHSATVEVETRDQTVHTIGLGGEARGAARVVRDELPGIDDGGEALELRGRIKATIPSDGCPHRVAIFEFEAPAETALICVPERLAAVVLRSRQVNPTGKPLLAGPVDLIRRSGLVGRTSILYVAPGERFELGWGPDPSLRVSRTCEELERERKLMSSWTRRPRRIEIKLSNLAAAPTRVEVTERIAVSEVEKVEVELVEASHAATADADGFVTWTARLQGFGHEQLELRWSLVVHDDVAGAL